MNSSATWSEPMHFCRTVTKNWLFPSRDNLKCALLKELFVILL
jgi:hypothetical protein